MGLPSIAGDIPLDVAGQTGGPTPAAVPPLSFFDRLKLGYKQDQARPSWGFNETNWKNSALSEIADAMRKKGVPPVVDPMNIDAAIGDTIHPGEDYGQAEDRLYRQLFAQVAKIRGGDANFLPEYAAVGDKASFDELVRGRQKAQLEDVGRTAPDGLGLAGFLGGIAHGAQDPINFLPIGGEASAATNIGTRILQNGLRWGAINAGVTAVTEPLVRQHAQELGVDRTNQDFMVDLLSSGATGFALGGPIAEGFRFAGGKFVDALKARQAPEQAPEQAADNPAPSPFDGFDAKVAQTFADIVPREQRTPDEQAAIDGITRDAEVKATSPFVPSPAGDDAHARSLDTALHRINNPDAAVRRGTVKPIARESIAGPDDVDATRMPARELLKARIHAAEGDGPNRAGGSALGPYQFEPRTWVSLFKRRYPNDTRSFEEIASLRTDPHLNDVLVDDLISENAAALRHAGFEENAGNLYLAHVLGHDRAVTVLRADPAARLGDLLPADYFKGNPFRPTDSAAALVHWAYGRMGDKGLPEHIAAAPVEGAAAAEQASAAADIPTGRFDVEALYGDVAMTDRPILNPDLFASPEEHAAAQVSFGRERDAADGFAPVMSADEAFSPYEHFRALKDYANRGGAVTNRDIGQALGIRPEHVAKAVRAMMTIDRNSPFILARERGAAKDAPQTRVMRRPAPPGSTSPMSLVSFLKSRGGISAEHGSDLIAMDAPGSLVDRRLHDAREALLNVKHSKLPPGLRDHRLDQAYRRIDAVERSLEANPKGMALDDALHAAIEAGFFPEHSVDPEHYADLPDTQILLDAIDEELRGNPLYRPEDAEDVHARARARYGDEPLPQDEGPPETADQQHERLMQRVGHNLDILHEATTRLGVDLRDDDMLIDASDLVDRGMDPNDAIEHAALASAYRHMDEAAAETGDGSYVINPDERFANDDGLPEQRGSGGGDFAPDAGGGRPESVAEAESEARARLAQHAGGPEGGFSDPVGAKAEEQADSLVHDLEMAVSGSAIRAVLDRQDRLALRQRWLGEQERKLGRDAAMDKLRAAELADEEPWLAPGYLLETYRDDPDGSAHILEAIAEHGELQKMQFRLDEEGGESDIGSILDEINEAQKAAAEMRNCLKPNGGGQ